VIGPSERPESIGCSLVENILWGNHPGGTKAEFAVLVGNSWQGKGLGATLMKQLIAIAKERGIESVLRLALAENTNMLALGRKLGFSTVRVPDASEYELELGLGSDIRVQALDGPYKR